MDNLHRILISVVVCVLLVLRCEGYDPIRIVHLDSPHSIAKAYIAKEIIQNFNRDVEAVLTSPHVMWRAVATNEADISFSAWLPTVHNELFEKYGDMVDIDYDKPNYDNVKVGIAVPRYVELESIEEFDRNRGVFNNHIYITQNGELSLDVMLEDMIESNVYQLLGYDVLYRDYNDLEELMDQKEWFSTLWTYPYGDTIKYNLKFLHDPNSIFDNAENVYTIISKEFGKENGILLEVFKHFDWRKYDLDEISLEISEGGDPSELARQWIHDNYLFRKPEDYFCKKDCE